MTLEQRIDQVLATSQPNPELCQDLLREAKIELASLRQQLNLAQRRSETKRKKMVDALKKAAEVKPHRERPPSDRDAERNREIL